MKKLRKFKFQQFAIDDLFEKISAVWVEKPEGIEDRYVYFVAPTGAGKTVMIGSLLERLTDTGTQEGLESRAYIWLTPRPLLAKQSRRSLEEKYALNCRDFGDNVRVLKNNEIFFCNWELLKTGNYGKEERDIERNTFWKMIDATREHRDIVLLIDEAHFGVATERTDKIIQKIDPAVVVKFSATLEVDERDEDRTVMVEEESVIDEGLITKEIKIQTGDEILESAAAIGDDDGRRELFLQTAKNKRDELVQAYRKIKADINPLVLIQLPNEMRVLEKENKKAEEERQGVRDSKAYQYLVKNGVDEKKIAIWLSEEKQNLERGQVEQNDSEIEYLFFKMAVATGWDCPRAKILVVFRNVSSKPFKIQTIGRIRRMPTHRHYKNEDLNISYVYTEYNKADSDILELERKKDLEPVVLQKPHLVYQGVDEINEVTFQSVLKEVFDGHFSIGKSLEEYGVEVQNPVPSLKILKDKKSATVREFHAQLPLWEREDVAGLSRKKMLMQEEYNEVCEAIITETRDDFNLNYSFDKMAPGKLKRALNIWLKGRLDERRVDRVNLVALQELQRDGTLFKKLAEKAIEEYAKVSGDKQQKKESYEEYHEKIEVPPEKIVYFNVGFDKGKYKNFNTCSHENFAFSACYLKKDLTGPEKDFIHRMLVDNPKVVWWYKQKDFGKSVFGVKYFDRSEGVDRVFYPDFMFKTATNKLFIVDTKEGMTAKSDETADKAKGLYDYIQKKKKVKSLQLVGGVAVSSSHRFMLNQGEDYVYSDNAISDGTGGWEDILGLL